jgi:hypothetical protein
MARTRIKVVNIHGRQTVITTFTGNSLFKDEPKQVALAHSSDFVKGMSKSRRDWLKKTGDKIRERKEKEARRAAAYAKHDERMWHIEQKYLNV